MRIGIGQRLLIATKNIWTKHLDFATVQCALHFSKSTKKVFSVHGAWHSPSTLPTMVHGQAFLIKT